MKFLKGISLVLIAIMMATFAQAGVNLKNGNFYISYTDIVVPGGGKKLEITRTYNSKSTEVGWFGFGCKNVCPPSSRLIGGWVGVGVPATCNFCKTGLS